MDLARFLRDVPDFPRKGILFKDVTPLLNDAEARAAACDAMAAPWRDRGIRRVAAIEARGFLFGALVAERLGAGLVPVRKGGKLPAATLAEEYELEYGTDRIEMHRDAVADGDAVLVVDDVLATGGTVAAAVRLVRAAGGRVLGVAVLLELEFLHGRRRIEGVELRSVLRVP